MKLTHKLISKYSLMQILLIFMKIHQW